MPNRPAIKIIQNRHFLTTTPEKSVCAVAAHMRDNNEGVVLVVAAEDGKLLGICTERDLAFKVLAAGLDATSTPVGSVMTANPQTIHPEKPFGHALHLMYEGGFRHMPVVDDNGSAVGLVAAQDALALDGYQLEQELMRREEITVLL